MTIGIDFGYSQVKMVQLDKTSDGYSLQNIGIRPLVNDISKFNPETIGKSNWVAAIQDLCKSMKINPKRIKNVVSVISGSNVSVRQLSTMEMSKDELLSSLEFEAKKHIPMDGSEPILDYHVLGSDPKELDKILILLVATSRKLITFHNEILKESGVKHGIFEAEPVALANAYVGNNGLLSEGSDVILNIGNQNTTLVAWGKTQKFFTREINTAGHHFTQATAKALSISYKEAEDLKIEKGINSLSSNADDSAGDSPFSLQMAEKTIYTTLTEEIRKTLRYYMKNSPQAFFNKFYLTGGSAALPGLVDSLSENLNMKVEILDPFEKIENADSIDNPAQYAIAIGAAIRGLEKKTKSKD
mgnify:CR=1 FL=1